MSNKLDRPIKAEVKSGFSHPLMAGALIIVLSSLAGCSSVPDAVNPSEWYKSTVDFFSGEDEDGQLTEEQAKAKAEAEAEKQDPETPGENKPFPNLSTVPQRPTKGVQDGLVADVDKRKYAQPIPRQGEVAEIRAPQPPPPPTAIAKVVDTPAVSPVQPAPPATPAAPVTPVAQPLAALSSGVTPPVTTDQKDFASITPKAITLTPPAAPAMPANAMSSLDEDPYGTVVVSSQGIEMAAAQPAQPVAPVSAPKFSQFAQGAPAAPAPQVVEPSVTASLKRASQGAIGGVKVATIMFETGSSGLSGDDRRILSEVARLHKQRGGSVTVVGHASSRTRNMDPIRHKMVNYNVSVDRAEKIADILRSLGIPSEMITVDARADNMPLYYETMPSGEAGNRRAEIYFQN